MSARVRLLGGVNRGSHAFFDVDYAPPEWTDEAACASADPEIFFTSDEKSRALGDDVRGRGATQNARAVARVLKAKTICAACPVREECLSYALRRREEFGVWGGLTRYERAALSKLSKHEEAS